MKRLIIFSLVLAVTLAIFGINQSVENCYALSNAFIDVIGSAKKEVEPNVANVRFGINAISEDIRDGQNKINTIIEDIENAICEKNYGDCELIIEYSSCYPKFNNGITNYYFSTNVVAKTSDITNVNELIAVACDNGATSYYNVSYELDNYEDIYQEVLLLAKDNAYKKACGINSDISQVGFKEMSLFNYCNDSKIIVEASIRARYEVLSSNEQQESINKNQNNSELNSEVIENNGLDDFDIDKEDYIEPRNQVENYQIPEVYEENSDASVVSNNENNSFQETSSNEDINNTNDNNANVQTNEDDIQIEETANNIDNENINNDDEVNTEVSESKVIDVENNESQNLVDKNKKEEKKEKIDDGVLPNGELNENDNDSNETNQLLNNSENLTNSDVKVESEGDANNELRNDSVVSQSVDSNELIDNSIIEHEEN